ncbi:MAG: tRNA (guanosine(46)-N7)-methyltransferase TrmB [Phycisphaeraceae bacterium]|nr:tRNA (guanosine(46)-N7)-methyltransferase TrmB [Phycisphaeraceae bacterium]
MATSISSHGKPLNVGDVGLEGDALPPFDQGPLPLDDWFDPQRRGKPLELEIGSGKGTFLVRQALAVPDVNYIGLEYAKAFWRHAADRCRRHALRNVKLVYIEAGVFLRQYAPDAAFEQAHIYFPDPWPKNRHHKRRLVQESTLRELARTLRPRGRIRLATDHAEYHQWMLEHAAKVDDVLETLPFESPAAAGEGELVGTNFERKYQREGRPFFALILRKRA